MKAPALALVALFAASAAAASPPVIMGSRHDRLMGSQLQVPVRSLVEMRFEKVVRQSEDLSCGAAALATILRHYYGQPVEESDVINRMLEIGDREKIMRGGFSMLELKRFSEELGFVTMGFRIDDIRDLEKAKIPVIIFTNLGRLLHYVVLRSAADGQAYIADPYFGNHKVALADLDKQWTNRVLAVMSATVQGAPDFAIHEERSMDERTVQDLISLVRNTTPRARGLGDF